MANTTVQLKKSGVSGNVPASLNFGELAINYADGKLFYKHANNSIASISTGSTNITANSFATVNSNSSLILATSSTDTLSFAAANTIRITTNTTSKLITIGSIALANQTGTFGGDLTVAGNLITTGSGGNITGANVISANTFNAAVSYVFADGTTQTTAASPVAYTQAAFAAANLASGVNATQNTNISAVDVYATSAYGKANSATTLAQAAFDKANTGVSTSVDQYARDTANSALPQTGGSITGSLNVAGTLEVSGVYSLPTYDGINGQALVTNGAGIVSWETISGGSGGGFPFVDLGLIADTTTTMVDMGTLA